MAWEPPEGSGAPQFQPGPPPEPPKKTHRLLHWVLGGLLLAVLALAVAVVVLAFRDTEVGVEESNGSISQPQQIATPGGTSYPSPTASLTLATATSGNLPNCANARTPVDRLNGKQARSALYCLTSGVDNDTRSISKQLQSAAQAHASDMGKRQYFSHPSPNGQRVSERVKKTGYLKGARKWRVGENLGWGTGALATPAAIVRGWLNSPGHAKNIKYKGWDSTGVGVWNVAPNGNSGITAVQVFGQK